MSRTENLVRIMSRTKKLMRVWPTIDVVAAACAAHRINGCYVKYKSDDKNAQKTNRELVYSFLEDTSNITDVDRQQAEDIKLFYNGYTFKVLAGEYLSDFDLTTMKILEEENTTEGYNLAVLASIPASYLRAKKSNEAERRARFAQGGLIGNVGDNITMEVEVLKSVFSQKWNTHYITAINNKDQVVFFTYKHTLMLGTLLSIKGKIKSHRDGNVTQLNRVKVLE